MAMPRAVRQDSMQSTSSITWNRPPSPTFSTTTTGSKVNLAESHTLISRKDLRASILCFEDLLVAAKAYRNALLAMSSATASFASAMEACSRVKGCRGANAALAGGAGLQYLISNHEQLLADTVYRQFEIPLLEALDNYKMVTADRLASYEKSLHAQSEKIRKTEGENMKVGRRRKRDLQQFRNALAELQRQVDELDAIKLGYHEEVLDAEDENWDMVLSKVAFVIRSQLDFYEKIAGKVSDPVLEPLVMSIPDPFDAYGPPKEEGQIFSVLSPLNLDSMPTSPNPNITRIVQNGTPNAVTPRASSPSKLGVPAAQTSVSVSHVDAVGERGMWDDDDDPHRAHRALSVIDEREGSPERSLSKRLPDEESVSQPVIQEAVEQETEAEHDGHEDNDAGDEDAESDRHEENPAENDNKKESGKAVAPSEEPPASSPSVDDSGDEPTVNDSSHDGHPDLDASPHLGATAHVGVTA